MGSHRSRGVRGVVNRRKENRCKGGRTSLLAKAVMDLWLVSCEVTNSSCLDMLGVEGVKRVEMVTAVRCVYSAVRSRF